MRVLLLSALALAVAPVIWAQDVKPCDSTIAFVDKNMIDYTIKIRAVRGSITDNTGVSIYKGCIALFDSTRSTLLRTVEADSGGNFQMNNVRSGDYWLVVQDGQRVFCPAVAHIRVRWYARKSRILAHMDGRGIDSCSYCESR